MRNRTYGGVRGRKTKVGRKLFRFPPTRLFYEGYLCFKYLTIKKYEGYEGLEAIFDLKIKKTHLFPCLFFFHLLKQI